MPSHRQPLPNALLKAPALGARRNARLHPSFLHCTHPLPTT